MRPRAGRLIGSNAASRLTPGRLRSHKARENQCYPGVDEDYLRDLRATLDTNRDRARSLLTALIGPITLRPDGGRLVGEVRGNLPACWTWSSPNLVPGGGFRIWRVGPPCRS
jgi:hypothetical protein